jgi:hypothetical protein
MSALADLLNFYCNEAWVMNDDNVKVPSPALLADRGVRAMEFKFAAGEQQIPEASVQANYRLAAAEIADAIRDLITAMGMPHSQHRTMRIGTAAVKLQNAEYRIRSVTRS